MVQLLDQNANPLKKGKTRFFTSETGKIFYIRPNI